MMYFGIRLKKLREEKGITQTKLAELIGVKRATVSLYESSGAYPSVEKLIKVSRYFKVNSDYLLGLMDSERFDMGGLTDEQAVAVQEIIFQFEHANAGKEGKTK